MSKLPVAGLGAGHLNKTNGRAEISQVRPVLGIFALAVLSLAMVPTWGCTYTLRVLAGTVAALLLALTASTCPDWMGLLGRFGKTRSGNFQAILLMAVALLLSGQASLCADLLYNSVPWATTLTKAAAVAGFLILVTMLIDLRQPAGQRRGFWLRVVCLFLTGGLLRIGAVMASPEPLIDVYAWLQAAPGVLLQGKNPYAAEYPDVYATSRAHAYGLDAFKRAGSELPAYPPLPILLALPFRAAGLDVRYANVACDLLAALVLVLAGRYRRRPRIGALAAGIYLHLPRVPFMIEQAWYEPMLAAALGAGLLLTERGRGTGYFLLGLGLIGKQYGLAMFLPLARAKRRQWQAAVVGLALAAAAVILPFFLWNPRSFLDVVLFLHCRRPVQLDSITFQAAAFDLFGVVVSPVVWWVMAAVLIGWVTWRTSDNGTGSALALGTALLIFSLCHTQGYFNYFYLCQYLLLLGIVGFRLGGQEKIAPEELCYNELK